MIVGGAASAGLNPESENVWEGTSGDFVIPDDDIYGIYASASVSCDQIIDPDGDGTGTISISIEMDKDEDGEVEEYFAMGLEEVQER